MIVAGDFNAPTGSGNLIAVESVGLSEAHALAGVGPGWTWPRKRDGRVLKYLARLPGIRIDHVYLSDELTTTKAWVGDDHGSDHLGVAAEVAWRAGGLTAKHAARAFNSAPQRRMLAHMANRLARETSPYLLQHKDNPVDWFPWGEAAFAQARRRNVPVFLSVGYSTCYWCHVMEREVFENEEIAATMNERFVNVKVDREERPDVDEHYMTATQVLNDGQGGWPMSVFLKPDGEPFFAGTYFPPVDMPGRPGFPRVLESLSEAWQNNRADIDATAEQLRGILGRLALPPAPDGDVTFDDELLVKLVNQSVSDRDPRNGGFGTAPKFPRETLIETLLCAQHFYALDNAGWAPAIRGALDAMADGGIRDHLGGGFHRYSTDAKWLVPHFEMMLYDQAMLAWCYVEAYKQFEHGRYGRIARGILDFVLREMTDDGGAFYTAFDAEVDGSEGQNYLWTPQETIDVLGEADGRTFNAIYGLDQGFNFADPHGPNPHAPDRNVLFLAQPRHEGERHVGEMRRRLLEARDKRKGPTLDTKILTSWNGLMIRALAHAAKVLQDARYQAAAEKAANWLLRHHRNANGGLLRSSRDGRTQPVDGILDDYANLARGLVALWSAGGNEVYLDHAGELAAYMRTRFEDEDAGGYFYADAAADEIGAMSGLRRKIGADNPLPSGNASAALLMLELGKPRQCRAVLEAFAGQLADHPGSMCAMLEAAIRYKGRSGPFKVAGRAGRESRQSPPRSVESESAEAVEVSRAVWATPRRLDVTLHVARGFHLYAESTDGTRAVEVGSPATSYQRTEKPPPRDGGRYVGDVTFKLHFGRPASDSATEVVISYQACDATRCLLPMRKVVEVRPRA